MTSIFINMTSLYMILIVIGIGIFLTPFLYGSEHHMDDIIHFLFHGWGIVVLAVAYNYRKKLK